MSKKNKIQKQLLKAQIERNAQALASGKSIEQINNPAVNQTTTSNVSENPAITPKEIAELTLIKKDIMFSIILICAVVVCSIVIYALDSNMHFLLPLANKLFNLLQR